ncbi:MAG: hypothetical protein J5747_01635 [Spirochaetaceae bacterium]|nr:hypothetical protein [Spirochaetaceae bacterium]
MTVLETLNTPNDEFTPLPFWFWNDELSEVEIKRQILEFKQKGVNGFVLHPRMGLPKTIPYLSERYFHFVRFAVELAARNDMQVILYDEAMYPSGSCHGKVVAENAAFASQGLAMVADNAHNARQSGSSETLIATCDGYDFVLMPTGGTIRGVHYGEDDGELDAPPSADLLNPEAVKSFIRNTHEVYYSHLKEYFGTVIKAFFTDEPAIMGRNPAPSLIPWSSGIYEEFLAAGGKPENMRFLFEVGGCTAEGNQPETSSKSTVGDTAEDIAGKTATETHAIYRKVIHNRLAQSYYKQLHDWCESHGIALTGHPEKSTDIGYLKYFHIPSQDIVWRFVAPEAGKALTGEHSCMAKCSSDSARHRGKLRNGNECFGVCSRPETPYSFTEDEIRWYLNWLFVRGVNMIFPHAFFYSLRGNRKDERPPDVGLHCSFWDNYRQMTDFIKRMCGLLSGAVNMAKVAVLCTNDTLSWRIAKPLFENQIEFNYLEEELLPSCKIENRLLKIQEQAYSVIIYDDRNCAFTPETMTRLQEFAQRGIPVIRYETPENLLGQLTQLSQLADCRIFTTDKPEPALRITLCHKENEFFAVLVNESFAPIDSRLKIKGFKPIFFFDAFTGEQSTEYTGLKPNQCVVALLRPAPETT